MVALSCGSLLAEFSGKYATAHTTRLRVKPLDGSCPAGSASFFGALGAQWVQVFLSFASIRLVLCASGLRHSPFVFGVPFEKAASGQVEQISGIPPATVLIMSIQRAPLGVELGQAGYDLAKARAILPAFS